MTGPSIDLAVVLTVAAWVAVIQLRLLARRRRRQLRSAVDLGTLQVLAHRLAAVDDPRAIGDALSAAAADLCDARGAYFALRTVGGWRRCGGVVPAGTGMDIGSLLETGNERWVDPIMMPVRHRGTIVGTVVVPAPTRIIDGYVRTGLRFAATLSGAELGRHTEITALADPRRTDPATGALRHAELPAVLAAAQPGDGILVVQAHASDCPDEHQRHDRLGLHIRAVLRPGDSVVTCGTGRFLIRAPRLTAPVEVIAVRLLDTWRTSHPTDPISVGATTHTGAIDAVATFDTAIAGLQIAVDVGGDRVVVAPTPCGQPVA